MVAANVVDEGVEAPGRLPVVVGEQKSTVGGDGAPGLADGTAPEDGFREQQEQNLREDLFGEVGNGEPPRTAALAA